MKIIYTPKGRAREYGPLAANLIKGCPHGCRYCYVPAVLHIDREEFHAGCRPIPDALEKFGADCEALQKAGNAEPIHMSFTCDPWPSPGVTMRGEQFVVNKAIEDCRRLTKSAIRHAHTYGQAVNVLTKSGIEAGIYELLSLLQPADTFGVTLTCNEVGDRKFWEPRAETTQQRIEALRLAHDLGIRTRVSFEPVLFPEQTLAMIRLVRPIADLIQVGKTNLHQGCIPDLRQLEAGIDWADFARKAKALLEDLGGEYYIKHDLAAFLEPAPFHMPVDTGAI